METSLPPPPDGGNSMDSTFTLTASADVVKAEPEVEPDLGPDTGDIIDPAVPDAPPPAPVQPGDPDWVEPDSDAIPVDPDKLETPEAPSIDTATAGQVSAS